MTKIVITHKLDEAAMNKLKEENINVVVTNSGDPKIVLPELKDADGYIIRLGSMDQKMMEQCPKLKVIGRPAVGVDQIDVKAATKMGIPVVIAPGANSRSVAEHSLTLMLACIKDVKHLDRAMRNGNFLSRYELKAYEIQGKVLGLLGYGHVGSIFANMAATIGMNIIVYDPYIKKEAIEAAGYGYRQEICEVLQEADAVSIHTPLTPDTKGMINEEKLKMMKSSAVLINCARGSIVDEAALDKALTEKWIMGAGFDVIENETNAGKDNPLFKHDNFIITPHMAGQTKEASYNTSMMAVEGTLAVIRGEKWDKVCNPDAYNYQK